MRSTSMGEAEVKGSIAPGKYADMTVFTDDLFAIPKERIKDANIAMTIVGGDVVYTNN